MKLTKGTGTLPDELQGPKSQKRRKCSYKIHEFLMVFFGFFRFCMLIRFKDGSSCLKEGNHVNLRGSPYI